MDTIGFIFSCAILLFSFISPVISSSESVTYFGFNFLHSLNSITSNNNIIFSPYSIHNILSMICLGSQNNSRQQLLDALGYSDELNSDLHIGARDLLEQLNSDKTNENTFNLFNMIVLQTGWKPFISFIEDITKYYDAEIREADFRAFPKIAQKSINNWVKYKTNDQIKEILTEPIKPTIMMMIVNAIYFKGTWKYLFDSKLTRPLPFYNEGKKKITTLFMTQRAIVRHAESTDAKLIELPYSNGTFSMVILLPKTKKGHKTINLLSSDELFRLLDSSQSKEVQIEIPKFRLEQSYDLKNLLPNLNVTDIFDSNKADLSLISPQNGLYVNKAVHKAIIDVSEEGTEAAAVSIASTALRSSHNNIEYFTADHPFYFFIIHKSTYLVLFSGKLAKL